VTSPYKGIMLKSGGWSALQDLDALSFATPLPLR
jgi:hypothetical protein